MTRSAVREAQAFSPPCRFVIMEASDRIPSSWQWQYAARRIAVVELTPEYAAEGRRPKMISARARGVQTIVETWNQLRPGKTDRCEYGRAKSAAEQLAARLNANGSK